MLIDELKSIEVLLRTIISKSNLNAEILSEFEDEESFDKHKKNLFNIISIDSLLNNYPQAFPFSLESFLKTGIIPNMYDEKTNTPIILEPFKGDYRDFYSCMIKALKDGDYTFDSDNNIQISNSSIEVTIPQIWLYRLQSAAKRGTHERIYFYNKNNIENIPNTKALIEYLRRTKSFFTRITTSNPNADFDLDFVSAQNIVKSKISKHKEIKVETLAEQFIKSMPNYYNIEVGRYKLANELWLVKKAESLGSTFYKEPIAIQEKLLNKWIIDRQMSREVAFRETQKYILLVNPTQTPKEYNIKEENIIIGLFNLFIKILTQLGYELSSDDLSLFDIKSSINISSQTASLEYRKYSRLINEENEQLTSIAQKANELFEIIKNLDIIKEFDLISSYQQEHESLLTEYKAHEQKKAEYIKHLNQLDKNKSKDDYSDYDGNISSRIVEATKSGQVYLDGDNLIIEIINSSLAKPIFKTTIKLNQLLELIENINFGFEQQKRKIG